MGVRITSDEGVAALYDSVSGTAFGPVFDSEFKAEDFLEWHQKNEGLAFEVGSEKLQVVDDVRRYRPEELARLVQMFHDQASLA